MIFFKIFEVGTSWRPSELHDRQYGDKKMQDKRVKLNLKGRRVTKGIPRMDTAQDMLGGYTIASPAPLAFCRQNMHGR